MLIDLVAPDRAHSSGKHYINLLWEDLRRLCYPISQLAAASQAVFSDKEIAATCLNYNENRGYSLLRRELSLAGPILRRADDPEQLCITGGASQSLATILQVLTDPLVTAAVWMTEPCYFQACRVFEEAGLAGKLRPVPEDEHGVIDLEYLEHELSAYEAKVKDHSLEAKTKPRDSSRRLYRHVIFVVPTFSNPAGAVMSSGVGSVS